MALRLLVVCGINGAVLRVVAPVGADGTIADAKTKVGHILSAFTGSPVRVRELWLHSTAAPSITSGKQTQNPSFLLRASDKVSEVLRDSDVVEGIDEQQWIQRELEHCTEQHHQLIRQDFQSDKYLWVECGRTASGRLYVCMRSTRVSAFMLELFSRSDLNEFGEGHHLIADKRVEAGHAVIYLDVSGVGDSVSRALELSLQMNSDPQPMVVRVVIVEKNGELKLEEHRVVQDAYPLAPPSTSFTLPPPYLSGPVLTSDEGQEEAPMASVVSDTNMFLKQAHPTFVQCGHIRDGKYGVMVATNFNFSYEEPLILTAEYKDDDGEWKSCGASVGVRQSPYYYRVNDGDKIMPTSNGVTEIAFAAFIDVSDQLKSVQQARRVPKCLPRPLHVRYILTELSGRKSHVECEWRPGPLELPTKENQGKDAMFWMQCDDATTEDRIYVIGKLAKQRETYVDIRLSIGDWTKNHYLYERDLRKLAYHAFGKAGTGEISPREGVKLSEESPSRRYEIPIDELCHTPTEASLSKLRCSVFAVADIESHHVYGLKFVLETSTSTAVEYFHTPDFSA